MLNWLLQIDERIFNYVQERLQCVFLDKWMPIITEFDNWIWVIALAWLALFIFGGKRGRLTCIVAIVAVLIADNLNSYLIKPFFGRLRPDEVVTAVGTGGFTYSFPSNHAVNVFTLAMTVSWFYPKVAVFWFLGAGIVGFSRIYLGEHYPFDVVAGAVEGILIALMVIWFSRKIEIWLIGSHKGQTPLG